MPRLASVCPMPALPDAAPLVAFSSSELYGARFVSHCCQFWLARPWPYFSASMSALPETERAGGVAPAVDGVEALLQGEIVSRSRRERRGRARVAVRAAQAERIGVKLRAGAIAPREIGQRRIGAAVRRQVAARLPERPERAARALVEIAERVARARIDRAARRPVAGAEVAARIAVAGGEIARGLALGGAGAAGDLVLRLPQQRARARRGLLGGIAGEDVEDTDDTYSC